jgi:vanillate/3-O-methylgallate O-demethylase
MQTLQEKIDAAGGAVPMLRNAQTGPYVFPVPQEHSNWRDEQRAWSETAVLFDQSFHMTDVNFRGPGLKRLLAENSVNDYMRLVPLKAFQFTTLAGSGKVIADGIGICQQNGSVSIIGKPTPGNYLAWIAETEGHDVEITRDARTIEGNIERRSYRFQLHGPAAYAIFERAMGRKLPEDMRFFGVYELELGGLKATSLRHGMTGGEGLEFWGPFEEYDRVLATILEAGEPLGLRRGGARAYGSAGSWSGWVGSTLPAVYSGEDMAAFRRAMPGDCFEGILSLGGSFASDEIEDFYFDPWDLGYHRFVHWEHEFRGRDALLAMRDEPHRRKVWLRWRDEDVIAIWKSQFGTGPRAKFLEWPWGQYANSTFDAVRKDGAPVGISINPTYTVQAGGWFSVAVLDHAAADGDEVVLTWGEPDGGTKKPTVEPHRQVEVRAVVATSPV